ncbi:unnamed protein product [Hermetia illucens]|uniref:Uncharacterized protein n=1 Tax=Hermetia illucens TaxID=343691 RepID=A0A7R8UVK7_HERIL|nr:unnamed protein product [Hermetia illucens]
MQFDRYCVLMHISKQFCAHTLYEWLDIVDPINKLFQSEMGRRLSGGEVLNGTDAAMGKCCRLIILFKKGKVYSRLSKYNIESGAVIICIVDARGTCFHYQTGSIFSLKNTTAMKASTQTEFRELMMSEHQPIDLGAKERHLM